MIIRTDLQGRVRRQQDENTMQVFCTVRKSLQKRQCDCRGFSIEVMRRLLNLQKNSTKTWPG
jgi:hypothetical protein